MVEDALLCGVVDAGMAECSWVSDYCVANGSILLKMATTVDVMAAQMISV